MNTETNTSTRDAGVRALAIVGFLALVAVGMWLAIYSARFVPGTVGRIGSAAVSLFSSPTPAPLPIVGATTTPDTVATTTTSAATTTTTTTTKTTTVATTPGTETSSTYPIGTGGTATLYGLPDLAVNITAVGYLTTSSPDSFVQSATVPANMSPAVKFTVKNIGTNTSGIWEFTANIPTQTTFVYQSVGQQSLNPGDSIDYTLGFSQPLTGIQTITVHVNGNGAIAESNTANDTATAQVTIQ